MKRLAVAGWRVFLFMEKKMSKEYAVGSIIHLETTYIGSGYVESGKGCNAFEIPLLGAKVIAHFPPKLEMGMFVLLEGSLRTDCKYEIIGIDGKEVWLKSVHNGNRMISLAEHCNIIA